MLVSDSEVSREGAGVGFEACGMFVRSMRAVRWVACRTTLGVEGGGGGGVR